MALLHSRARAGKLWGAFPDKWKRRNRSSEDHSIRAPGGGMGRGQLTGKGPPARGSYNQGTGGPHKHKYGRGSNQYQGTGHGQGFGANGEQVYGWSGGQPTVSNQYRGPNQYQGGGPAPREWCAGWTDSCHSKIKEMMDPYLECYSGRLFLAELLNAAGKRKTDLPTLPKFTHANGRPFLCWNFRLGQCTWRECKFQMEGGHPHCNNITNKFATTALAFLQKECLLI